MSTRTQTPLKAHITPCPNHPCFALYTIRSGEFLPQTRRRKKNSSAGADSTWPALTALTCRGVPCRFHSGHKRTDDQ